MNWSSYCYYFAVGGGGALWLTFWHFCCFRAEVSNPSPVLMVFSDPPPAADHLHQVSTTKKKHWGGRDVEGDRAGLGWDTEELYIRWFECFHAECLLEQLPPHHPPWSLHLSVVFCLFQVWTPTCDNILDTPLVFIGKGLDKLHDSVRVAPKWLFMCLLKNLDLFFSSCVVV